MQQYKLEYLSFIVQFAIAEKIRKHKGKLPRKTFLGTKGFYKKASKYLNKQIRS